MRHILVIDDEEKFTWLVDQLLTRSDYKVTVASSGIDGLRLYKEEPADLVIVDVFMPRTSGLDVIRRLKRDSPQAKIIAISGGGDIAGRDCLELAAEAGAECTIRKQAV